ncbi:MAG: M48 family metalloprotease, partial [Gaiellaceae bacterium]
MLVAARNILKSWLLVLALTGVFALVGWLLDGVRGLSIFAFCALLLAAGAYWTFDRVVLGMIGARELPVGEAPLLHSTVERLAARAGIVKPRLYLIPDGLPIAAATGRGVRSSALAMSTGCVAACTPAELEGVLAHELAHVKHRDILISSVAATLAAAIMMSARFAMFFGGGRDDDQRGGNPIALIAMMILAPIAAMLIQAAISRSREYDADAGGASIAGSPLGLVSA